MIFYFCKRKGKPFGGGFQAAVSVSRLVDLMVPIVGNVPGGKVVVRMLSDVIGALGFDTFYIRAARVVGAPITATVNGSPLALRFDGVSVQFESKIKEVIAALGLPLTMDSDLTVTVGITLPMRFFFGSPASPRVVIEARNLGKIGSKFEIALFGISFGICTIIWGRFIKCLCRRSEYSCGSYLPDGAVDTDLRAGRVCL